MKQESYETPEQALDAALEYASDVLPAQGPIGNFVHHNTLHAFQHLPFHEAIRTARALHDAEDFLSEAHERRALHDGRFDGADLARALELRARALGEAAHERIGPHARLALEHLLLRFGLTRQVTPTPSLRPDLPEPSSTALRTATRVWLEAAVDQADDRWLGPDACLAGLRARAAHDLDGATACALWAACRKLAPPDPLPHAALLGRVGRDRTPRDLLRALAARDPSALTNPVLIDFLSAYLDERMVRWPMPGRAHGMLACFVAAAGVEPGSLPAFQRRALARIESARRTGTTPRAQAIAILSELGVGRDDYAPYLSRSLLALPGWSGMVARLERTPSDRRDGAPPSSLLELAVLRLALDVEAYADCAAEAGYVGHIADFGAFAARRLLRAPVDNLASARALFDLCQLAGIAAPSLWALGSTFAEQAALVVDELDAEIRPLLHEACEHAYLREVLDALAKHREAGLPSRSAPPNAQLLFCSDDREESMRRHVEEYDPDTLTYGVAGFIGVAMRFRGIDDADLVSLCPVVNEPDHAVEDVALEEPAHDRAWSLRREHRRRAAHLRWEVGDGSRSLARGAALMPLIGLLSALPLTLRVLFTRAAERLKRWLFGRTVPAPRTRLLPGASGHAHTVRAVDLSQARPELGHATNAVCIVGRRALSQQLFLDRRCFLASYCADIDPDLTILARILGAVVPVGAGINLAYYFSAVDSEVWGSGTKLRHNLSGLLGVMEGARGDLRMGLPRQRIEVHDPVRLLSIVEASPEAILEVARRRPEVRELVEKEWVRVASLHPQTGALSVFDGGSFRPYHPGETTLPTVGSAAEWYRGNLDFLSPVRRVKGRHQAA